MFKVLVKGVRQTRWLPFEKTDPLWQKFGKAASFVSLEILDFVFDWRLYRDMGQGLKQRKLRNMADAQLACARREQKKDGNHV